MSTFKHTIRAVICLSAVSGAVAPEAGWAAEPATPQTSATRAATPPAAAPARESQNAEPAVNTQDTRPATGPRATPRAASDRLQLDTTVVTGNRELPKVLYIVPWKKADLGDLPAQPFNSLVDEVLTPVDRDVFRREVAYYEAVSSGAEAAMPSPSRLPASGATDRP